MTLEKCHYCRMSYHPMPVYTLRYGVVNKHEGKKMRLIDEYFGRSEHWRDICALSLKEIKARIVKHGPLSKAIRLPVVDLDDADEVAAMILQYARYRTHRRPLPYPGQIYVCHIKVVKTGEGDDDWTVVPNDECKEQAIMDGYEYRCDLTPVR